MPLTPGYGETPVEGDEWDALLPSVRELVGEPITKSAIYDFEQAVQEQVAEERLIAVLDGRLGLDELLTDVFVRELHNELYQDIWTWAGRLRTTELSVGVAPESVAVELRVSLDTIRYRWNHTSDWSPRELGMVAHAEAARVHPFVDGNGRSTRLLADLVFVAAQDEGVVQQYNWELEKTEYINLLREFDVSRNVQRLASFVSTRDIDR